jgi:hypothetical protein
MNKKESHPYLDEGNINGATKLILGSFPVYACTDPDNAEKLQIRNIEGTVRFFYGSCRSRFWGLYHRYIDTDVIVPVNKELAINSLTKNNIAISDTIKSCERKGTSALDSDLRNIEYNTKMIQEMLKSGVSKILCTSKGVLDDLNKRMLLPLIGIKFDEQLTKQFESEILQSINGSSKVIKKPFCMVYSYNGEKIYAIAIPSPGSPQRQAHNFGCTSDKKLEYANNYFKIAFNWLKK